MVKRNPKEVAPATYEQLLEAERQRWKTVWEYSPPQPVVIRYQPGESVRRGNLPDVRVEGLEKPDGSVLHISYADKGTSHGTPYDNNRRLPQIVPWHELLPLQETEHPVRFSPEKELEYTVSSTSLDSILNTCLRYGVYDNPDYQRGYVWTRDDEERLLDSVFNWYDIGKFVYRRLPFPDSRIEIIDGKQRLKALLDFVTGKTLYHGVSFFHLHWRDCYALESRNVQYIELSENTKKSQIMWLFLAVNAGGVPQTAEHLEHARKLYEEAVAAEKAEKK